MTWKSLAVVVVVSMAVAAVFDDGSGGTLAVIDWHPASVLANTVLLGGDYEVGVYFPSVPWVCSFVLSTNASQPVAVAMTSADNEHFECFLPREEAGWAETAGQVSGDVLGVF